MQNPFLDSYVIEFLDLPDTFHESDFRKALAKEMRDFMLELGKDFTFVGEEYPIQVANEDYKIDLLFYHRSLKCLVAIELKIGKFKPEYISKMDFYLEGLDRQIKKEDENPSVGLILCASKEDEVVEYAILKSAQLINEQKATAIIEHITYHALDDCYGTEVFTEPTIKGKLNVNAMKAQKHLYDHIVYTFPDLW